jgi:tetratricopeptide (TPR) repeat protein
MKTIIFLKVTIAAWLIAGTLSCKATPAVVTTPVEDKATNEVVNVTEPSSAVIGQEEDCPNKFGKDSLETLKQISVYREFFRQDNFDAAIEAWRYVFTNAPCAREQTHLDGIVLYKRLIKAETAKAKKESLIDTLFLIYDTRFQYFKNPSILGRKGTDMLIYRASDNTKIYETFKKAIDLGGNDAEYFILSNYFKTVLKEFASNNITKEQAFEEYEKLIKIADYNIANEKNADKYREARLSVDGDLSGTLIKDCDELEKIFGPKYAVDKSNKNLQDMIFNIYASKNCFDSDIFLEVATIKFQSEPNAKLAYVLARKNQQAKNYSKSAEFYQKAIDMENDSKEKANYLYDFAVLQFNLDNFSRARSLANEALRYNSNLGKALILIGDLYAASSGTCGGGFEGQTVFWAAVDKYQRARAVDVSVADDANRKIANASKYFPSQEDIFFRSLKAGASYQVGCWIGETTTVRIP